MKGVPADRVDFGTATVASSKRPPLAAVARQAAMAPHTLSIGPITPAGRWVVTIPGWHPVSANKLIGVHRMKAHRLKAKDARRVADEAALVGVPRAVGRRRVRTVIQYRSAGRPLDPDNVSKSLRDALAAAGLIVDDSAKWAEFTEPVVEKGKKATVITIEDVT